MKLLGSIRHRGGGKSQHSIINQKMVIAGDIEINDCSMYIDGKVNGAITGDISLSRVVVRPNGLVNGPITARHIVLMGNVVGDIVCSHFEIFDNSKITGSIKYEKITMHGGIIAGEMIPVTEEISAKVIKSDIEKKQATEKSIKIENAPYKNGSAIAGKQNAPSIL